MSLSTKKNPAAILFHCLTYWYSTRRYAGLFSFSDAFMNWRALLLPSRFSYRADGESLARETRIEPVEDGVHRVTVLNRGIMFYWLGPVTNNLYSTIAQEFDPRHPHHYTTPPIHLNPDSLVLDVGACEGLFAYRVLRQKQARKVICFEPSARVVKFLRLGAQENGVVNEVAVETAAVGRTSQSVRFVEHDTPDASHIAPDPADSRGDLIQCVSLDDYCERHGLAPGTNDLIKIDAEGADLDVLRGAERLIRSGAPQIAVTTYHKREHAHEMVDFLKRVQPRYHFRLKGFATWVGPQKLWGGVKPPPALLQAAVCASSTSR